MQCLWNRRPNPAVVVFMVLVCGVAPLRALPAFPGAKGFGAATAGGRGGRVLAVTTLAAHGPGSLHEACSASGPRIVVFRVSGVIPGDVTIEHGSITILGQTAPGAGVTRRSTARRRKFPCRTPSKD